MLKTLEERQKWVYVRREVRRGSTYAREKDIIPAENS
jgi:hypothetical protein